MSQILQESIYEVDIKLNTGRFEKISFWDKWKIKEEENDGNFVEPDVFLSFEKLNIIVEAKRWDDKQQSSDQWKRELKGYFNEYSKYEFSKPIILLALGGIHREQTDFVTIDDKEISVYKSRWSRMLNIILNKKKYLERKVELSEMEEILIRIFEDLITSFELHGFFIGTWFSDEIRLKEHRPNNILLESFLEKNKTWKLKN